MNIDKIISQNRRDFVAIFLCEHCNATAEKRGYDDDYFHRNVIPRMKCEACGLEASPDTFRPMGTKYPEGQVV